MPWKPKKPCAHPGCGTLTHERFCAQHERQHHAEHDARRRAGQPWRKWYTGARWKGLRLLVLAEEPLCRFCGQRDMITAATVVDHIVPHRGDERLFFDRGNLQSLCKPCHDGRKQSEERRAARGSAGSASPTPASARG